MRGVILMTTWSILSVWLRTSEGRKLAREISVIHHIGGHHFELEVVQCKCLVSITVTWVREETLSSSPSKCLHLDLTLSAWIFLCPFLNLVNYLVHLNQWSVRISYGRQETLQPRLPPWPAPAPPGGPGERRLQSDLCVQPPQEGEYSLCLCLGE